MCPLLGVSAQGDSTVNTCRPTGQQYLWEPQPGIIYVFKLIRWIVPPRVFIRHAWPFYYLSHALCIYVMRCHQAHTVLRFFHCCCSFIKVPRHTPLSYWNKGQGCTARSCCSINILSILFGGLYHALCHGIEVSWYSIRNTWAGQAPISLHYNLHVIAIRDYVYLNWIRSIEKICLQLGSFKILKL